MQNIVFTLGSFNFLVWHLIVLLAVIAVIVVICVVAVFARKKSAKESVASTEPVQKTDEQVEEQPVQEEVAETSDEVSEEGVVVVEESEEEVAEYDNAEPEATEEEVAEEEAEEEAKAEQEGRPAEERKRPKNYHISLRADGKWQVKLSKGAKPLKLFDTQAQAIAFAKEKAKNQEGTITIHKVNGQIRKQKY